MTTSLWQAAVDRADRLALPILTTDGRPAPPLLPEAVALLAAVEYGLESAAPGPPAGTPDPDRVLAVLGDVAAARAAVCAAPSGGAAAAERANLLEVSGADLRAVAAIARGLVVRGPRT